MRFFRRPLLISGLLILGTLRTPMLASAEDLPKAETLLDANVEALGGKDALLKVKNRVTKGTMEIAGAGLKGTLVVYQAEPNLMSTEVEFAGLGKTVQGTNGKEVWEVSALTGNRVLKGDEKAERIRMSHFQSDVEWRKLYEKVETVGVEDVNGKPAYKVVLTPKVGTSTTAFFDKESKLNVRSITMIKSPQGEIEVDSTVTEFQKFGDIKYPVKTKQKIATQEILLNTDDIKQNVDLPKDAFTVPEEIKPLLKKVD